MVRIISTLEYFFSFPLFGQMKIYFISFGFTTDSICTVDGSYYAETDLINTRNYILRSRKSAPLF